MSRIGRKPVIIPEGVTVKIDGNQVMVSGPKGTLQQSWRSELKVIINDGQLSVSTKAESKEVKALFGTTRALLANMIKGVSEGFSKTLKLVGTGFRAKMEGEKLALSLGFSHPVIVEPVAGVKLEVEGNETIKVSGVDKMMVGQVAAKIRDIRPPDVYKGKGIRYQDEVVRKKAGKAGKTGVAGGFGPQG